MTAAARSIVVNAFLASILGTMVAHRQASAVLFEDIGGVPIVAYAFVATLIPVVVFTSLGNRFCRFLAGGDRRHSASFWYVAGAVTGTVAGALVALVWRALGSTSGGDLILAGCTTGAICGVVQAAMWLREARSGPKAAVA